MAPGILSFYISLQGGGLHRGIGPYATPGMIQVGRGVTGLGRLGTGGSRCRGDGAADPGLGAGQHPGAYRCALHEKKAPSSAEISAVKRPPGKVEPHAPHVQYMSSSPKCWPLNDKKPLQSLYRLPGHVSGFNCPSKVSWTLRPGKMSARSLGLNHKTGGPGNRPLFSASAQAASSPPPH